jgi:hypothetical protein
MSKNINVNPDHYKSAGRERQGENIVQSAERQAFEQQHALNERWQAKERERRGPSARARAARQPSRRHKSVVAIRHPGISNREDAQEESQEREKHPPLDAQSPPPEDAAGRVGEEPLRTVPNRQTSHKAGSRSIAQKEGAARYPDRSMPASRKVAGAFGKEPTSSPRKGGR